MQLYTHTQAEHGDSCNYKLAMRLYMCVMRRYTMQRVTCACLDVDNISRQVRSFVKHRLPQHHVSTASKCPKPAMAVRRSPLPSPPSLCVLDNGDFHRTSKPISTRVPPERKETLKARAAPRPSKLLGPSRLGGERGVVHAKNDG